MIPLAADDKGNILGYDGQQWRAPDDVAQNKDGQKAYRFGDQWEIEPKAPEAERSLGTRAALAGSYLGKGLNEGLNPLNLLGALSSVGDFALKGIVPGLAISQAQEKMAGQKPTPTPLAGVSDWAYRNAPETAPMRAIGPAVDWAAEKILGAKPKLTAAEAVQPEAVAKAHGTTISPSMKAFGSGLEILGNMLPLSGLGGAKAFGPNIMGAATSGLGGALGEYAAGDVGKMVGSLGAPLALGATQMLMTRRPKPPITTLEQMDAEASAAFDAFKKNKAAVTTESFGKFKAEVEKALKAEPVLEAELQPKTLAIFRAIEKKAADTSVDGITMGNLWGIRRAINKAIPGAVRAGNDDDVRLLMMMKDKWTGYVSGLKQGRDALPLFGNVEHAAADLKEGIAKYARKSQAEEIQGLIDKAILEGPQRYVGPNIDKALRTKFNRIANNPDELRKFKPDIQQLIVKVATGTPLRNAVRYLGKFSPSGVIPGMGLGAFSMANPVVGIPLAATTFGAGKVANRMALKQAQEVVHSILRGYAPPKLPPPPFSTTANRGLLAGLIGNR